MLGGSTLSEVSILADEVRRDPRYKQTAPWHYINLPVGLSREQFEKQELSIQEDNVYNALEKPLSSEKEFLFLPFKVSEIYLLEKSLVDAGGSPNENYKSLPEKQFPTLPTRTRRASVQTVLSSTVIK